MIADSHVLVGCVGWFDIHHRTSLPQQTSIIIKMFIKFARITVKTTN